MRKQKRKFSRPFKPWNRTRLEEESKFMKDFGLRRKRELWKLESILRNYRRIARGLAAKRDKEKEKILLDKLFREGLVKEDAKLDDALALSLGNILERRLQTMVFRKNLCSTIKQARQFIVHGHIALDGRRAVWPSILVNREEENKIGFYGKGVKIGKGN